MNKKFVYQVGNNKKVIRICVDISDIVSFVSNKNAAIERHINYTKF
jgi:hypothetical protein